MKPFLAILLLAVVIDAQYYNYYSDYEEPEPEYSYDDYYRHPYYGPLVQQPRYQSFFYPSAPSYQPRRVQQHSYGRQFVQQPDYGYEGYGYGERQQPLYALYDPYEYEPQWVSPYAVRPSRPSYFWTTHGGYGRMARKGNKGNKKGNKKGGGGHNEDEGGWWYIRDKKGCISGTWGKPPPHGLEREHYSQGACGYLGGHSQRGKGQGAGWSLPHGGHKGGPAAGNKIGGGGGYGGGGGGGYGYGKGRQGGRYASAYGR